MLQRHALLHYLLPPGREHYHADHQAVQIQIIQINIKINIKIYYLVYYFCFLTAFIEIFIWKDMGFYI